MRRSLSVLLVLAIALCCLPCGAAEAVPAGNTDQTPWVGFRDVAEDRYSYDAIMFCARQGLLKGEPGNVFDPAGVLHVSEAVTLAARLYSLGHGGEGAVPELPDLDQPCIRFLDSEGAPLASFRLDDAMTGNFGALAYVSLSRTPDDPALPETCTMEIGFEGYAPVGTFQGTRESHDPPAGVMNQGLVGTGYRFGDESAAGCLMAWQGLGDTLQWKDAWWYPYAFYLASQTGINLRGELIYRLTDGHNDEYDALTGFTSDAASRALFAWLVDLAVDEELTARDDAPAIPDVDADAPDAGAILRLYRAGIIRGVDGTGRFFGEGTLTREQAATILTRVLDETARVAG